jgi:predicted nucleic acid-binding protein
MNYFYLDASAYAKYYYPEPGSDVVMALVNGLPDSHARRLIVTSISVVEVIAVLNRRRNELAMPDDEYGRVVARLLADVTRFTHWRVQDQDILNAAALIPAHNLNTSDALHLYTALRLVRILNRTGQDQVVMVAADRRLLRAASAEGMAILDPEAATLREVSELITGA